jgi:ribosomal protein L32
MAATPKHRRSSRKAKLSRSSNRYDKQLTRAKVIKKYGGSHLVKSKITGELVPAHRVSADHPEYKNIKIINK